MVEYAHTDKLILVNLRGPNTESARLVEVETPGGDEWEITIGRKEISMLFGEISELPTISRKHWTVKYHMYDPADTEWMCVYNDGNSKITQRGNDFGHAPPVVLSYQGEYKLEILAFFLGDFVGNRFNE